MAKNQHTQRKKILKILLRSVSLSKIGHDFSNKVVQKLTEEKKCFNKKWSPKLILFNEFLFFLNSVDFWNQKLTLKLQFWHFLTNCRSSTEFFSFEYVDSWPKILLFRTHHLWNSTTELILIYSVTLWILKDCVNGTFVIYLEKKGNMKNYYAFSKLLFEKT